MRSTEFDQHLGLRVPAEHHRALVRIAAHREVSVSEIVREAIEIICEAEADTRRPTLDDIAESNPFVARAQRRRR